MKHLIGIHGVGVMLITALAVSAGCGRPAGDGGDVLATANGEKILVKDFQSEMDFMKRKDPLFKVTPGSVDDQIDVMIDKKILIQEARKNKMDESGRFVSTIKAFWEQTLIRDLMERKQDELAGTVSVSEQEIKDYYAVMPYYCTIDVLEGKSEGDLKKYALKQPQDIEWDDEIGPVAYDDVSSGVIQEAFRMSPGGMKIIKDGGRAYLVYLKKAEKMPVAPYDSVKGDIKERIKDRKVHAALMKWLEGLRRNAEITVDEDKVKKLEIKYGR
ncbi:MAG: hypothetical protein ABH885_00465 [Candidatus Omnitrophota bacterium]